MPRITLPDYNKTLSVPPGVTLMDALKENGIYPDAPCGGNGACGKCAALVNGREVLACRTAVHRDMTVTLPKGAMPTFREPPEEEEAGAPPSRQWLLAFDIGTTTVVCALLEGKTGKELARSSMGNPQAAYGADVITRIRQATQGKLPQLTQLIRQAMTHLTRNVCDQAGISPQGIGVVSVVGNPAMRQLFLGICPDNLSRVPFAPALTEAKTVPCRPFLPCCTQAQLLIPPDIAGFIGADTLGCLLATRLYEQEALTLLVDIGTNGEMVLGNRHRMIACAAAAGPALEGASIRFGMRAAEGAIDHVWTEGGKILCSVIGGGAARGICGSGLVDAVAAGLRLGLINQRGKLLTHDQRLPLTEGVWLTQEDIRQVQLAKGAIHAGISLLARQLGAAPEEIQEVKLAGAFGSFLDPENACRIGLLPEALVQKIEVVGNAALSGAKILARDKKWLPFTRTLAERTAAVELSGLPSFPRAFAEGMLFREAPITRWLEEARKLGFSQAVALDPQQLVAREDVRGMCAENKCGAYNKNWTCPPAIGSVEDCQRKMRQYRQGILLQTLGHMRKAVDARVYRQTEQQHLQQLYALAESMRREYPHALFLGAGGCRICKRCAHPEPCRFPDKAVSSMEGYGLFVTQVCRDAGIAYHHGDRTVTYTACVLF